MPDDDVISALGMADWEYATYFRPPGSVHIESLATEVEVMVKALDLPGHPFFGAAKASREALNLWVTQELVMTNAFSQIVLIAASRERNVHARSILSEVAHGEHSRLRAGVALRSHPWLLHRLCKSMGIAEADVTPTRAVTDFISRLTARLDDPLHAALFIGVGNELLIVPECEAIRQCFQQVADDAEFEPFLRANLQADKRHAHLCIELGAMYVAQGRSESEFLEVAAQAASSRVTYFDDLMDELGAAS